MAKILLVEDEEVIARIYKKKLTAAGHEAHVAYNVEEANGFLSSVTPDLLLVDHGIRGQKLSGIDLIRTVRKQHPDLHIIMLSNYNEGVLKQEAIKAGANEFFVKINTPPKVLIHHIEDLLR